MSAQTSSKSAIRKDIVKTTLGGEFNLTRGARYINPDTAPDANSKALAYINNYGIQHDDAYIRSRLSAIGQTKGGTARLKEILADVLDNASALMTSDNQLVDTIVKAVTPGTGLFSKNVALHGDPHGLMALVERYPFIQQEAVRFAQMYVG